MSIEKRNAVRKDEAEKPWMSGAAGSRSAEISSLKEKRIENMEKQYAALVGEIEKLETDLKNGDEHTATMTPDDPKRKIAVLIAQEVTRRLGELKSEETELKTAIEEIKNPKKIEHDTEVSFE
ncbi:MAG: hypothetical protein WAV50_02285 [Minisyncoccia bacterium]